MKGNISIFSWNEFLLAFFSSPFRNRRLSQLETLENYCRQEKFCCRERHKRERRRKYPITSEKFIDFHLHAGTKWKVFFPQTLNALICRLFNFFWLFKSAQIFFQSHFRSLLTSLWKEFNKSISMWIRMSFLRYNFTTSALFILTPPHNITSL